jgi:hypothetical protein
MAIDFMSASYAWDLGRVYWKARARLHLHFLLRCGHFFARGSGRGLC